MLSKTGFHTSEMADLVAAGVCWEPTQLPHYRAAIIQSFAWTAKKYLLAAAEDIGKVL